MRASGIIHLDPDGDIRVHPRIRLLSIENQPSDLDIRKALLGRVEESAMDFADFAHLGKEADIALDLLKGATKKRQAGVAILLYGPSGTGKTTFASALAKAAGIPLYAIGEEASNGGEPSRTDRLQSLMMANRLLKGGESGAVLIDEAEDLLRGASWRPGILDSDERGTATAPVGSKAYVNRALEQAPVPMILTANHIGEFDRSVLRRMSLAIEVKIPPVPVRAALWARVAAEEQVEIGQADIARLAQLRASPGVARSAMRAARLTGGGTETVTTAVTGVLRAMHGGMLPMAQGGETIGAYSPDLMAADLDLATLADRLSAPDAPRATSLLLVGPPGSGKSLFARHLAQRMGMEVMQKRASDLLGKYVGENEAKIAAAFRDAAVSNQFLIIDEIDSILPDRRGADRHWIVSMVEEALTWMENHPLPFCGTSNYAEAIDPAALRRFVVKAEFQYLSQAQVEQAWHRFFTIAPPPGLAALDRLTPADFALVKKGAALYGILDDGHALLRALLREQKAKGGGNPIGFLRL